MDIAVAEHDIYALFLASLIALSSVHWLYVTTPESAQWLVFLYVIMVVWKMYLRVRELVYKGRIPTGMDIAVVCSAELFFVFAAHIFAALASPVNYRRIEKTSLILVIVVLVNGLLMLLSNVLMNEMMGEGSAYATWGGFTKYKSEHE